MRQHSNRIVGAAGIVLAFAAGCATTPPPRELVSAREANAHLRSSLATELAPVEVHASTVALERAERAYRHEDEEPIVRNLAYMAERRAQLAASRTTLEMAHRQTARAQIDEARIRASMAAHTQVELGQTRRQLAAEQFARQQTLGQLTVEQIARDQAQTELGAEREAHAQSAGELQVEQAAHVDAEARAAAAIESLRQLGNVREDARGTVLTLSGSVVFLTGQSTLLPAAQLSLDRVAAALRDYGDRTFEVEGHTDSRGSTSANQTLSQQRAESVRSYLVSHGVPSERIRAVGFGPSRPVGNNGSAEGRAKNRRVEIVVQPAAPQPRYSQN